MHWGWERKGTMQLIWSYNLQYQVRYEHFLCLFKNNILLSCFKKCISLEVKLISELILEWTMWYLWLHVVKSWCTRGARLIHNWVLSQVFPHLTIHQITNVYTPSSIVPDTYGSVEFGWLMRNDQQNTERWKKVEVTLLLSNTFLSPSLPALSPSDCFTDENHTQGSKKINRLFFQA